MNVKWIHCLAVLAGTGLWMAAAASGETAERTYELDRLIVRAERDLLYEPTRESAAIDALTDSWGRAELQQIMPATTSAALIAMPGIHTETRGRKYKQFHSFRGQIYPYPDVVFDGVWQRDARELLYVLPGAMIEEINIVRSPATLFHGLADVVGLIEVVPRRPRIQPDQPPATTVGVEGGSLGTVRAFALHAAQGGPGTAYQAGGQYYRTDGPSGRNAGEEIYSAFGGVVYEPDPDHLLRVAAWTLYGYRQLEQPDPDGPASRALKNRRETYDPLHYTHLKLSGQHRWSDRATTAWHTFYSDRQARYTRRKIDPDGPGPGDTVADEDDREYGAQVIQGWALTPDNTLRLGGWIHRWTAPDGKQSYVGSRQDVSTVALVVADEQRVGDWTLDVGARYARSYFHDFNNPGFTLTGQSVQSRRVQDRWDDAIWAGTAGATRRMTEHHQWYAHAGAGARNPGPGARTTDGTRPDREDRYTVDGGWIAAWGPRARGHLRVGGFSIWRQSAIVLVNETGLDEAGDEFYFSGNRDIRQQGIETDVRTPGIWDDQLFLFGNLTWMRSQEKQDGAHQTYREVPSLIATAGLQAEVGRWDASLRIKHVDSYENFRFSQDGTYQPLGDYWDVTLTGGIQLGRDRNIRLYALVENVLDDDYSTVVGWNDPGRRYRAGLEATF